MHCHVRKHVTGPAARGGSDTLNLHWIREQTEGSAPISHHTGKRTKQQQQTDRICSCRTVGTDGMRCLHLQPKSVGGGEARRKEERWKHVTVDRCAATHRRARRAAGAVARGGTIATRRRAVAARRTAITARAAAAVGLAITAATTATATAARRTAVATCHASQNQTHTTQQFIPQPHRYK
jgi:hypothetical protein